MALNWLDTEEMVHITSAWLIRGRPDRTALESDAALAALIPEIEAAHLALLDTHARELGLVRKREIQRRQDEVVERHDDSTRGVQHVLLGTIALTSDPLQLATLRGLKQRLLPEGVGAVEQSYGVPADPARTVAARLTDSDWALLERVPIMGGRSLRDVVKDWLGLAHELERLERARLLDDSAPVAPEAALAARQRWIDVVQAVRDAARGSKKTALLSVLARVSAIEQRAHRRAAQRGFDRALSPSALSAASATTSVANSTATATPTSTAAAGAGFEDVGVDTLQLSSADIAAAQRLVERRRHRRPARGRG